MASHIKLIGSSIVLTLFASAFVIAQEKRIAHEDETSAQIPVLHRFHAVIFPMWHTAWPEKNTAILIELLPGIKHYRDSLSEAQLPGILRDKQEAWTKGIEKLQAIVTGYEHATSIGDTAALLDAAEQLHAQYEGLVRITRPVLKELDAFHQTLYMLYHHYVPDWNLEEIAASATTLKERMNVLSNAALPDRLKGKEKAFNTARAKLAEAVAALDASVAVHDRGAFTSRVESMHSDYQALEAIFD